MKLRKFFGVLVLSLSTLGFIFAILSSIKFRQANPRLTEFEYLWNNKMASCNYIVALILLFSGVGILNYRKKKTRK